FHVSVDRLLREVVQRGDPGDIRLIVLDVDGVLTNGGLYHGESGEASKRFHTRDGRGILEIMKQGIEVAILSGSFYRQAIWDRAERLGIQRVYVGKDDKFGVLKGWLKEAGWTLEQVAYVGDDLNDLTVMPHVGLSGCPADAADQVKQIADVVLRKNGGEGCVREFIEMHWQI
ncbi:MAG: HAD-IIIA family hydrolase, partial [Bacteroidota bacterium]